MLIPVMNFLLLKLTSPLTAKLMVGSGLLMPTDNEPNILTGRCESCFAPITISFKSA
jgi:hypothetical protein